MTYEEYKEKYGSKDHVLIRMTDSFPYFKEKYIIENGEERIETNYHIADGVFSRYTNYELPNGYLSAETSWTPVIDRMYLEPGKHFPVLITNVGSASFEVNLKGIELPLNYQAVTTAGIIHPDEVLCIFPYSSALDTIKQFEEMAMETYKTRRIGQEEINLLLGGGA